LNLAEVLHRITLVQCVPGYRDPERSDWDAIEELAGLLPVEDAQLFYQIAIKGRAELGLAPDPRTGLEMTLLRMLAFRPATADSAAPSGNPSPGKISGKSPKASTRPAPAPVATVSKPLPKAEPVEVQRPEPAKSATATPANSDWVTLLHDLKLSGQARELARNVQLKARSDDHWDFVIAPSLRYLRSDSCVSSLSRAISDQLGHQVNVRIVDEESTEMRTAATIEQQKVRESMSEAEKAINDDPTVKALKEQMGAQVVEDSIQPLQ
jgi:DNA polymerase-3 subunit gamma/tau